MTLEQYLGVLKGWGLKKGRSYGYEVHFTNQRIIGMRMGRFDFIFPLIIYPLYVLSALSLVLFGLGYLHDGSEQIEERPDLARLDRMRKDVEIHRIAVSKIVISEPEIFGEG